MKFNVEYTATITCKATIEADSLEDAKDLVDVMLEEGEFDYNTDYYDHSLDDFNINVEEAEE